jgi:hypothetical protein
MILLACFILLLLLSGFQARPCSVFVKSSIPLPQRAVATDTEPIAWKWNDKGLPMNDSTKTKDIHIHNIIGCHQKLVVW